MSGHTSWKVVPVNNADRSTLYLIHLFVDDEQHGTVCGIWAPAGHPDAHRNARLLASAPDLLAALNEIEAEVEGYVDGDLSTSSSRLANRVMFLARAAVGKAVGP